MSKIDDLFGQLKSENRKALMPFITAGDPSLELTSKLIQLFDQKGCHICEIGIPYSDPIADGPVIQASYTRALNRGISVNSILETLKQTTNQITMPLVTMVSYAIIYRIGLSKYVEEAKRVGVSGLIVPDLPVEEANGLAKICSQQNISLIQLVTPTTGRERAKRILDTSTGFIYYVSVTGITGERTDLPPDIIENVSWLRENGSLPVCIGFGISEPKHVQQLAPHCDGLIVGSAIVRRITDDKSEKEILSDISEFTGSLLDAF